MKNSASKKPNPDNLYPRICLRIDRALLDEVDAIRKPTKSSYGQIVTQALRRYLPELKKFHAPAMR